jgi:hypothetical protein
MSVVQFLLDEDVAKYLGTAVDRVDAKVKILRVGQSGTPDFATLDPDLIRWAETNRFAIISNDRTTMTAHAANHLRLGGHTWGVFILRKGFTAREIVDSLLLIHAASEAEEWHDLVVYIPFT